MDQFKIQPIIDAATSELVALEVLAREPAPLHDPAAMRDIDLAALRYAALLRRQLAVRVHSNIEYSTILDAWAEVRPYAASGVVLELVERKAALKRARAAIDVLVAINEWRQGGGRIAFDDVSMRDTQILAMIGATHPDIVKVESANGINDLRVLSNGARVVVERIETRQQAESARAAGADELQGFYIDRLNTKLLGDSVMLVE